MKEGRRFPCWSLPLFSCIVLMGGLYVIALRHHVLSGSSLSKDVMPSLPALAVAVVISDEKSPNYNRVRDMLSGGPWPVERVFCSPNAPLIRRIVSLSENKAVTALMCSHFIAMKLAVDRGVDYALIAEDDARVVPHFWEELRSNLHVLSRHSYGILWLQYFVSHDDITKTLAKKIYGDKGETRLAVFNSSQHFEVRGRDGVLAGAAGYWISRRAMSHVLSLGIESFAGKTSEALTTAAAVAFGGFCAYPPLIWQCYRKVSYIQTAEHHRSDFEDYAKPQLREANLLLVLENRPLIPIWMLDSCL